MNEVKVLEKFSAANRPHPHIIQLLLTYQYRDKYYLLFHWAEGNLKEFWKFQPNPSMENARWLATQCFGIATGLRKIHHLTSWPLQKGSNQNLRIEIDHGKDYGRHGDIKPENILWFRSPSNLVISDFGLSQYHSIHSRSQDSPYAVRGFSPTYRPPEFELKKQITQRYDIWTLGCLFLEIITWFVLGNDARETDFSNDRIADDYTMIPGWDEDKFFNIYLKDQEQYTAKVKSSVKKVRQCFLSSSCLSSSHRIRQLTKLAVDQEASRKPKMYSLHPRLFEHGRTKPPCSGI